MKYTIEIPFDLELNECLHCNMKFAIIFPNKTEEANEYWFQTFSFCPYCGMSPNQPLHVDRQGRLAEEQRSS